MKSKCEFVSLINNCNSYIETLVHSNMHGFRLRFTELIFYVVCTIESLDKVCVKDGKCGVCSKDEWVSKK